MRDIPFAQIESACAFIKEGQAGQQRHLPGENTLTLGYDDFTVHYGGALPFPRHIPCLQPGQVVPLGTEADKIINDRMRFYSYWVIEGRSRELHRDDPLEATLAVDADAELSLRTPRPGDRFCPLGLEGHSQKVSDAFTNLKVPRMLRARVALLTVNEEIAWFVAPTAQGLQGRVAHHFAVSPQSESVLRVRWEMLPD
jgi:tRNA(Ile)-lysidine synthase